MKKNEAGFPSTSAGFTNKQTPTKGSLLHLMIAQRS